MQLREKQKVKRMYGVLERQFRRYFAEAERRKGNTGENLLQLLESRLDNVVLPHGLRLDARRSAPARVATRRSRSTARSSTSRRTQVKAGDVVAVREKAKKQLRILEALSSWPNRAGMPSWVAGRRDKLEGTFKKAPDRDEFGADINEALIVELYSR